MIYLHWTFISLYILTDIAMMITILLDNRQPAKTIAWLLVLFFMPFVGIILYIFFGQNTRKEKVISQQSLDQLVKRSMLEFAEQKDLRIPETYRSLLSLFANQSLALPFKDNEADIYTQGSDFFLALLVAIGEAQEHIHLESFVFADDPLGNLVADALIDRARQGVEVRVIFDDVGNWKARKSFAERMRDGGVDVRSFMPVLFPAFTSKANYRNHRKLCIIDGRVGFIGGMNIAIRYIRGTGKQPWRDTHMKVRGGAVYAMQRAFLVDWFFVDRTLITDHKYYPPLDTTISNNCIAQVVPSSPISPWHEIEQGYVRILMQATQYVYMETPYFMPTEPILFAMRTAAVAGVDVRLMVPLRGDTPVCDWASHSYLREVVEAGVKIYLYKAGFNHSKLLISDDGVCTCGSSNIDFRSFEHDFESNIFFYDREMSLRLKQVFLDDQKQCFMIDEVRKLKHPPFFKRLWESLVRLLSPLM
ncbi:MAG: cardiolipin synthase [Prevotella sp.]|nr:cardiolipin synthase [Prevotella sp.]